MSHPQNNAPAARAKSPLDTALLISFAIAAGAIVSPLDAAIFDEVTSGRWPTRPFAQTQERNTASIASLEQNVGAIGKDIDFVAARVVQTARRSEDLNRDRFAQIEARRKPAMVFVAAEPAPAEQSAARPERGHLFNVKPVSHQGGPLRLSRLPG